MNLTKGAVRALRRGALSNNEDVNAVTDDGVVHKAGQICCEDDEIMRKAMGLDEYQPVLEVKRVEWFGRQLCSYPMIKFHCVDEDSVHMSGMTNGGGFAYFVASRMNDGIASTAPSAISMTPVNPGIAPTKIPMIVPRTISPSPVGVRICRMAS